MELAVADSTVVVDDTLCRDALIISVVSLAFTEKNVQRFGLKFHSYSILGNGATKQLRESLHLASDRAIDKYKYMQ